jgi:DNA-binding transcriptional ArsR family regulator
MNRRPPGPAAGEEPTAGEALRAIAEPRRRAILRLVARDELAAGEIAAAFDVTRTAVSQHLSVLKNNHRGLTSPPASRTPRVT